MAEDVVITIKGDDQASDDLKRVLGALKDQDKAVNDLSGSSSKSAKSSKSAAGGMGKMKMAAAAGAAAVAGLAAAAAGAVKVVSALAGAAAKHGDNAAKTAQQIGVSAEALQEYNHVAELTGASQKSVETGFRRLARTASDAARGSGEAGRAFEELGISATDANGDLKDTPALTEEIADKFASMESETEKVAKAQELFGRSGTKLIPMLNQGSEGIDQMRQEARDLGIVMSEGATKEAEAFQDSLTRMKAVGKGVKLQLGGALLPALTAVFDAFRVIVGPIGGGTDGLREFAFDAVDVVIAGVGALVETLNVLSPVIAGTINYVKVSIQAWKGYWNVVTGLGKFIAGTLSKHLANLMELLGEIIGAGANAAHALGAKGLAGELRSAQRGIASFQGAVDGFSTDAFDSAKEDMSDIGDAVTNIGGLIKDLPGVDEAISDKLDELAGRVQEAQRGIADARNTRPETEQERPPGAPSGEQQQADDGGDDDSEEAAKKAAEEARRNELARARIEILQAEDELEKAKLERRLALNELADQELTADEERLARMEIEQSHQERLLDIQKRRDEAQKRADDAAAKRAEDRRKKEVDDIRSVAEAFKGTGSQMAADVGNVIDVFADIKGGSADSVDAMGAAGNAAASFAGQLGASAEAQAGIMAAFETAMGFATLFTNPAESAGHFLAAANFGMIAATGGGGGAGGGGASQSSVGQGQFRESADDAARASGRVLAENLGGDEGPGAGEVIYIDFSGATMLESAPRVQERIGGAVDQAKQRKVRRGARRG